MAHNLEKSKPLGGLNFDDSDLQINYGGNGSPLAWQDYRYAKNIRNAVNSAARGKALTNVKSNVEITKYLLPYTGGVFPSGKNRVIGTYEDTKYNTVVFAVWNSNGNHQILRYYRNNTDPQNPYGEVQQIMCYDFGWTRRTRITDMQIVYGTVIDNADGSTTEQPGDLLYFSDPVPKKINLSKANICNKHKTWRIYAPSSFEIFTGPGTFQLLFQDFNHTVLAAASVVTPAGLTNEEGLKYIADYLNQYYSQYVSAEACGCRLVLTEKNIEVFYASIGGGLPLKMYADNWYGTTLVDRFFDRCKWLPAQAPQPVYGQDGNNDRNYVKQKVFQFRLGYRYDDLEASCLGVWSQIATNNLGCDGTSNELYNYVDVDFNDDALIDETTLILLKEVEFVVRELNTGLNKLVISVNPCDYLDWNQTDQVWYCHYKFYNDILSTPIDANRAAQLFDDVPLESGAELFVKNRIVEGAVKTGYDGPDCVEATYEVEAADRPNKPMRKIRGRIRVLTFNGTNIGKQEEDGTNTLVNFYSTFGAYGLRKYPFWEPTIVCRGGIFRYVDEAYPYPYYGGGSFKIDQSGDWGVLPATEMARFNQLLPEGGWPVYAAGKKFLTISKQKQVGLTTDQTGAINITGVDLAEDAADYFKALGNDIYSEFELLVPDDDMYVIRLGSHLASFGDKLELGFSYNLSAGTQYQKTSTNVWGVNKADPATGAYTWLKDREITVEVSGSDVFIGDFVVADLAQPFGSEPNIASQDLSMMQPINGYLVDDPNGSDVNAQSYVGVKVEKTLVVYGPTGIATVTSPDTGTPKFYDVGWQETCITDHNGYWFGIGGVDNPNPGAPTARGAYLTSFPISVWQCKAGVVNNAYKIRDENRLFYLGPLTKLFEKTLITVGLNGATFDADYKTIEGVIPTTETSARGTSSSFITGNVQDQNGNNVPDVNIVYQNGGVTATVQNGSFSLLMWSDMLEPNEGFFSAQTNTFTPQSFLSRKVDHVVYSGAVFCQVTYPNTQLVIADVDPIGTTPGDYNPTHPYVMALFVLDEVANPSQKGMKGGGKWIYGLRYNDNPGRLCTVTKAFEAYVPFITEDLNVLNALPNYHDPNQYPAGTYKQGKRVIKWYLDPDMAPPQWAATYQWVRTKNTIYGRYLQWVANEITYLSALAAGDTPEVKTSFQNGDAVAIRISISNIVDYAAQNAGSVIGFQFQDGDRARLIADRDLTYFTGINDFEVTGADQPTTYIIIKPNGFATEMKSGMLFEIFNPKSVATEDEQIFWEVGEVFECTNPGQPDNAHGTLQGTFTNGDTYWHGRLITVLDNSTKFAAAYPVNIESSSVSDFYISEAQDIGRPGTIDPNFKQIELPTGGRSSGQFLPGTASNGLSTFDPNLMPTFEIDRKYDRIQRMFFEQNNLMVICSNKEVSNYINRQTLYNAEANTGVVALSGEFFGTQFIHAQNLGTDLPGTTVTDSGKIFGWRNNIANVWVYRGDGEKVISDEKAITFFDKLREDGVADAVAVYDRYHEEYIITYRRKYKAYVPLAVWTDTTVTVIFDTLPDFVVDADVEVQVPPIGAQNNWTTVEGVVTTIQIVEGKYWVTITAETGITVPSPRVDVVVHLNVIYSLPETIAWYQGSDELREPGVTERWKTFYDFTPENYSALGQELVGFVNGKPWIFNKNDALRNNFFGVQYKSKITPVFNEQTILRKVWNALWMTLVQLNGGNSWYSPVISNMYGQLSRLKAANWGKSEGNFAIPFLRDLNTTVVSNPILNGKELRSEALAVELENDSTEEFTMYSMRANYTLSERTSK